MTTDRIKEIQSKTAYPDSISVQQALLQVWNECEQEQLRIADVSKRFDFDKLLQDYRQEFVNGGGYVKSDTFESGTEPYDVFEWFKKKLS